MRRIPYRRATATAWRSSSAPSGPTSLKPAEITITAPMPAWPHSSISAGTPGGGVTITARSTGSGMALTDGTVAMPTTLRRLGLTG